VVPAGCFARCSGPPPSLAPLGQEGLDFHGSSGFTALMLLATGPLVLATQLRRHQQCSEPSSQGDFTPNPDSENNGINMLPV